MNQLIALVKECLSIIPTAIAKDNEISLLINSAINDMERLGINAKLKMDDDLIRYAIVMYVKGNFGNTDIKEKELCQKSYSFFVSSLASTEEYMRSENQ